MLSVSGRDFCLGVCQRERERLCMGVYGCVCVCVCEREREREREGESQSGSEKCERVARYKSSVSF